MWKSLRNLLVLALLLASSVAWGASVGSKVSNVNIRDADNNPATIPDLGTKVLAIFYADPDAADLNDPFADALKAANLPDATYRGMGIASLADTILPNGIVRSIIRKKIEKYDTTILTDIDNSLSTAWSLGSTNGTSVVIILDKTGTVRYTKKGALSAAECASGLALVQQLIAE